MTAQDIRVKIVDIGGYPIVKCGDAEYWSLPNGRYSILKYVGDYPSRVSPLEIMHGSIVNGKFVHTPNQGVKF